MPTNNVIQLTEHQLKVVVEQTVEETLLKMGVDVEDPIAMQKDFKNLREWSTTVETVRKGVIMTMVTVFVSGVLGLLWLSVKGSH